MRQCVKLLADRESSAAIILFNVRSSCDGCVMMYYVSRQEFPNERPSQDLRNLNYDCC